jgi:hypothetical protein
MSEPRDVELWPCGYIRVVPLFIVFSSSAMAGYARFSQSAPASPQDGSCVAAP